jgi:hypothetical protein
MRRSELGAMTVLLTAMPLFAGCADGRSAGAAGACSVRLTRVATVGPDAGPAGPTHSARIARSPSGQLFAAPTYTPGEVSIFDARGTLAGTFGRIGSGPGEFGTADDVRTLGDSVLVYDDRQRRIQKFSLDGRFIGLALQMPHFSLFALRSGGGILITGNPESTEDIRIETRDAAGVLSSFAYRNEKAGDEENGYALLLDENGEAVWIADGRRYLIEKRSYSGDLLTSIRQEFDWFPPLRDAVANPTAWSGRSVIVGLGRLPPNHLLVLIHRYPSAPPPLPPHLSEHDLALAARDFTRPIMHVLDAASGKLIAEVDDGTFFAGFADHAHVYASRILHDGTPLFDVFQVAVKRPGTEEDCS